MIYLTNAFSLSMIEPPCSVKVREVSALEAVEILADDFVSAIGHQSTADFLSKILGISIPVDRKMVSLKKGDRLVVAQLLQRLPEGVVLTAEEISQIPLKFFLVEIN